MIREMVAWMAGYRVVWITGKKVVRMADWKAEWMTGRLVEAASMAA